MNGALGRRQFLAGGLIGTAAAVFGAIPAFAARNSGFVTVGGTRIASVIDARIPMTPAGLGANTTMIDIVVNVLQYRGENVLVGTGLGDHPETAKGSLLAGLSDLGLAPADIDLIILTHLHPEHVGGLINRDGSPVFENARVVSCRTEWRWWNNNDAPRGLSEGYLPFVQRARAATRPYDDAGKLITFSGTEVVSDGVTGFPALGHTAGHSLFEFADGDRTLLTIGDLIFDPTSQLTNLTLDSGLDIDPGAAAATRRSILGRAAGENLVVFGSQLSSAPAFQVATVNNGFALTPAT